MGEWPIGREGGTRTQRGERVEENEKVRGEKGWERQKKR